jgi:hypothetical protein
MYGNAIHHAIKVVAPAPHARGHAHLGGRRGRGVRSAWSSEGFLSLEHEELQQAQGRDALRRFVARDAADPRTPLAVETEFKFKVGDDVVIGRWDRIDERREGIVLVDYKSSEVDDAEKARAARARTSLKDGQLGLYALAYHESRQVMPGRRRAAVRGHGRDRSRRGGARAPGPCPRARARGRRRHPRGAVSAAPRPAQLRLLLLSPVLPATARRDAHERGDTGGVA